MNYAQSERSTTVVLDNGNATSEHAGGLGAKAKEMWQNLKNEDKTRKEESILHVTPAEATKITGHGEDGPKSNVKDGKGDKRSLGALLF
jgi:hypothetical protein